ncbi:hypothetical protein [Hymenobacter seoulensis]
MPRLPSYTVLFILGTLGFALYTGASFWAFSHFGTLPAWFASFLGVARLIGFGLVVLSPFLMLLKFFRQQDSK